MQAVDDQHLEDLMQQHRDMVAATQAAEILPPPRIEVDMSDGINTEAEVVTAEMGGLAMGGESSPFGVVAGDIVQKTEVAHDIDGPDPEQAIEKFESSVGLTVPYENKEGVTDVTLKALEVLVSEEEPDPEMTLGARLTLESGSKEERTLLVALDVCKRNKVQQAFEESARQRGEYPGYEEKEEMAKKDWHEHGAEALSSLQALMMLDPTHAEKLGKVIHDIEEGDSFATFRALDVAGAELLDVMLASEHTEKLLDAYQLVPGNSIIQYYMNTAFMEHFREDAPQLLRFADNLGQLEDLRARLVGIELAQTISQPGEDAIPWADKQPTEEETRRTKEQEALSMEVYSRSLASLTEDDRALLDLAEGESPFVPNSLKILDTLEKLGISPDTVRIIKQFAPGLHSYDFESIGRKMDENTDLEAIDLGAFTTLVSSLGEEQREKLAWSMGNTRIYNSMDKLVMLSEVGKLIEHIDPESKTGVGFDTLCWLAENAYYSSVHELVETVHELNGLNGTLDVEALVGICKESPETLHSLVDAMKEDATMKEALLGDLTKVLASPDLMRLITEDGMKISGQRDYQAKTSFAKWLIETRKAYPTSEPQDRFVDLLCTPEFAELFRTYGGGDDPDRLQQLLLTTLEDSMYRDLYSGQPHSPADVVDLFKDEAVVRFLKSQPDKDREGYSSNFDSKFRVMISKLSDNPEDLRAFKATFYELSGQLVAHDMGIEFLKYCAEPYGGKGVLEAAERFSELLPVLADERFDRLSGSMQQMLLKHILSIPAERLDVTKTMNSVFLIAESGIQKPFEDAFGDRWDVEMQRQMGNLVDRLGSVENPSKKIQEFKQTLEQTDFLSAIDSLDPGIRVSFISGLIASEDTARFAEGIIKIQKETDLFTLIGQNGPGFSLQYPILQDITASRNPLERAKYYTNLFDGDMSLWALNYEVSKLNVGEIDQKGYQRGLKVHDLPLSLPRETGLDPVAQECVYNEIKLSPWTAMDLETRRMTARLDGMTDEQVMALAEVSFTQLRPEMQTALLAYRLFETVVLTRSKEAAAAATERNRALAESGVYWHEGDLVHATGSANMGAILSNGLLSGENLGFGSRADSYPFNLDTVTVSSDVVAGASHHDKLDLLKNRYYGEVCLVMSRDAGALREGEEFAGGMNADHRLLLAGMPATAVTSIFIRPQVGAGETMEAELTESVIKRVIESGVYIPVLSSSGEVVLSYEDYVTRRQDGNYEAVSVDVVDASFKRANTQKGSNEGAEFVVPTGEGNAETWYVKFGDTNPDHTWNEILADKLYALVDPDIVPDTKMVMVEGRLARASKMLPQDEGAPAADVVDRGFILDGWLGNWDAVYNPANIFVSDGIGKRIDTGNTLFFRARGDMKADGAFGSEVKEIAVGTDTEQLGGGMRQMYPGLSNDEIRQQVIALRDRATNEAIEQMVDSVRLPLDMRTQYKQLLKQRRDHIIESFATLL